MTFYRINDNLRTKQIWDGHYAHELLDSLTDAGVLERVPPCVHGWYDGHWAGSYLDYSTQPRREYREWCEGAELGLESI